MAPSTNGTQVAAFGLYEADFSNGFSRYGNGAVFPSSAPEPVIDRFGVGVAQGYVEESNVNAIGEMTQLIQGMRKIPRAHQKKK